MSVSEALDSVTATSVFTCSIMLICASTDLLLLLFNVIKVVSELKLPRTLFDPNSTFPNMLHLWRIKICHLEGKGAEENSENLLLTFQEQTLCFLLHCLANFIAWIYNNPSLVCLPENISPCLETFLLLWIGGYYWHLVRVSQKYCRCP